MRQALLLIVLIAVMGFAESAIDDSKKDTGNGLNHLADQVVTTAAPKRTFASRVFDVKQAKPVVSCPSGQMPTRRGICMNIES